MMASAASIISSLWSRASARSILAMTPALQPQSCIILRARRISRGVLGKGNGDKVGLERGGMFQICLVFFGQAGGGQAAALQVEPFIVA